MAVDRIGAHTTPTPRLAAHAPPARALAAAADAARARWQAWRARTALVHASGIAGRVGIGSARPNANHAGARPARARAPTLHTDAASPAFKSMVALQRGFSSLVV